MKKFVVAGVIAVGLLAVAQQNASAWVNSRFGVGLNWDYQAGGNTLLWGAWRNSQPPGPEYWNSGAYAPRYQGPMGGGFPPMPAPASQGFAPMPQGSSDANPFEAPYASQFASPYQFANYPRPSVYYYYPTPSYYGR